MFVKNISDIKIEKIAAGEDTFKQILISIEDAPNFAMRKFIIQPGGFMPLHTNSVEHEQYVLNGSAEVMIDGQNYIVKKDDIVFIPKEAKHSYKTIGSQNFEFLCLVPNQKDEIKIVE